MKTMAVFLLVCFLAVFSPFAAVQATERPEVGEHEGCGTTTPKPFHLPEWAAFVRTAWLPGGRIQDSSEDLKMLETQAGFAGKWILSPRLELATGLDYSLRHVDAPTAARLPESLHALSLSIGGEYRVTDYLAFNLKVSPGLSSDLKAVGMDDLRVKIALVSSYRVFQRLTLIGGIAYTEGNRELPIRPIIGASYQPSERWRLTAGFPRTAVIFAPYKGTEWYITGEFTTHEYHLHEASLGADNISYNDYRLVAGVDFPLSRSIKLGISAGYAFGRKFEFDDGNRDDVRLGSVPFGRIEVKFAL